MHKAIEIIISEDGMTVEMVIKREILEKQRELTYPGLPDILSGCEEIGVTHGINKDKILKNLKMKDIPIVIAKGKPIVPAVNDKVAYSFEDMRNKHFPPTLLANDKVDFYDLIKMKVVQNNEMVVFIQKGHPGVNGFDVTGKELIAEKYIEIYPDTLKRFAGQNTEFTGDGVVSKTSGIPMISSDGKVSVDQTFIVKGDVNFSTGSIEFEGPIIVKGSVMNNFTVKSPKDVIVESVVDGGIIESGGMVSLLGGINKGTVKCKGNLVSKYIYFSKIESERSIIVDEAILNSNLKATTIIAKGQPMVAKSGQISGGIIRASNYVWAKVIGSASSNFTKIIINTFIDLELFQKIKDEVTRYTNEMQKINKTLWLMDEFKKRNAIIPPDLKINQLKLLKLKQTLTERIDGLLSDINKIEKEIEEENKKFLRKVFISVNLFPKVAISILNKQMLTRQDYGPSIVEVELENNKLQLSPPIAGIDIPIEKEEEE